MLQTTIAAVFIALAAGAGISVACVQTGEQSARTEPRFTRYETPNHRHLTRFQDSRRAE